MKSVSFRFGNPMLAGNAIFKSEKDAPHTKVVIQQLCEGRKSCRVSTSLNLALILLAYIAKRI